VFEEKKGVGKPKKQNKKHYSVSVSSGSAEREHRGRAMSVLVNKRGQDQQREQPPIRRLGGTGGGGCFFFFLSVKPLHWLRTTKWLGHLQVD